MNYELTIQDSIQYAIDRFLELRIKPQNDAVVKQLDNEFVEDVTRQEKEWVKDRRVSYLRSEISRMLNESYPLMDLIVEEEIPKWFEEFIFETELQWRMRKIKSFIFQINMWNEKKFIPETASYDVEEIKDRNSIVDVIRSYGIELRRAGPGRHKALCPFHSEKTESFMVFENTRSAYCFGCNQSCDVISFIMKKEGCDFRIACQILS